MSESTSTPGSDTPQDQLDAYLKAVFPGGATGTLHWASNVPGSRRKTDWIENPAAWPAVREVVTAEMIKQSSRLDVYVCPYLGTTRKRTKGKAAARWVIHTDVDKADLDAAKVRELGGFAVSSGTEGHAHVYVPLAEPVSEEVHTVLCKKLCAVFGGDKPKHSDNDVLRPPGTLNHKATLNGGEPTPVEWLVRPDGSRVDPETLDRLLDRLAPVMAETTDRRCGVDSSTGIDLNDYPDVVAAITNESGDRSVDTMRIVGACYDANLTLGQTRWAVEQNPGCAERLAERDDDDVLTCWLKAIDQRQPRGGRRSRTTGADNTIGAIGRVIDLHPAAETLTTPPDSDGAGFFAKNVGLLAMELAEAVMATVHCGFTERGERFYVYENGVWQQGKAAIEAQIAALLGNRYRKSHVANVLDLIRLSPQTTRIEVEPVHPHLINALNGMVDWKSQKLLEHSPDYRSVLQLPVEYHPDAQCPRFDTFLSQVVPADSIEFVWELIGYAMYNGNPFHVAVLLRGIGRNGKGTFIRVLKALLGEQNCSSVKLHELVENRFRASTLYGNIANLAGDIDGRWVENTAIFKAITGGDLIQGEYKHGAVFEFTPWALPIYSANKAFGSADSSEGWVSRWIVLPFPNTFSGTEDRGLDAALQSDSELQGIMAKGIAKLPELMRRGRFSQPRSLQEAKREFVTASDALRSYLDEHYEFGPDHWEPRTPMYLHYRRQTMSDGSKQLGKREFYQRVEQVAGIVPRKHPDGTRGYAGIRLTAVSTAQTAGWDETAVVPNGWSG